MHPGTEGCIISSKYAADLLHIEDDAVGERALDAIRSFVLRGEVEGRHLASCQAVHLCYLPYFSVQGQAAARPTVLGHLQMTGSNVNLRSHAPTLRRAGGRTLHRQ